MAVTHDRYFLDNVAGWILELDRGKGLPFEGNYSSWLEQKQARLAVEEKTGVGAPAHARPRARVGAHEPARPAGEVEGARDGATRRCSPTTPNFKLEGVEIHIPAGPRLGDLVVEAEHVARASATGCSRGPDFLAPARRHRRRHRAERRRQDDAVPA